MLPHAGQPVETRGRPLGEGSAAMILVHGRGATPRNILDLADALAHPAFTYLAPAAAGNTWYPYSFMADTAANEPGLSSGQHWPPRSSSVSSAVEATTRRIRPRLRHSTTRLPTIW